MSQGAAHSVRVQTSLCTIHTVKHRPRSDSRASAHGLMTSTALRFAIDLSRSAPGPTMRDCIGRWDTGADVGEGDAAGLISPRSSCNCCCKTIVEAET